MPSVEKRGEFWRVRIRRHGFPMQSRTFDNKALAERWAREIENTMDRGDFVDRPALNLPANASQRSPALLDATDGASRCARPASPAQVTCTPA